MGRWKRQYEASTQAGSGNARQNSMLQLAQVLEAAAPARDAALQRAHVVHGDFRLDNLVFNDGQGGKQAVLAVLDWELSALGDPLSDLAYNCMVCPSWRLVGRLTIQPAKELTERQPPLSVSAANADMLVAM